MGDWEPSGSLAPFTTLKAGGPAERMLRVRSADQMRRAASSLQSTGERATILGWGSNVLPSDAGVPGSVLVNLSSSIVISGDGIVVADSGCGFQELFLKTAQAGLRGLEFAVGIPGTLGGALVSNAGAYRSCVSEFLVSLEVVYEGRVQEVDPSFMQFSYRDSLLRALDAPQCAIVRVTMKLPAGDAKTIYDEARDYQRQRIGKQPPPASAGSFFKNVYSQSLADSLDNLPERLRSAGVVPAGYLIEKVGLKGARFGGAQLHWRHANFMTNVGGATATEIRRLAEHARARVREAYGVELEEEVLYLGDWSAWVETGKLS
jgi:UDP-N-acetylmuramate dehydrogenase